MRRWVWKVVLISCPCELWYCSTWSSKGPPASIFSGQVCRAIHVGSEHTEFTLQGRRAVEVGDYPRHNFTGYPVIGIKTSVAIISDLVGRKSKVHESFPPGNKTCAPTWAFKDGHRAIWYIILLPETVIYSKNIQESSAPLGIGKPKRETSD